WAYKAAELVNKYGPGPIPDTVVTGPEDMIAGPAIGVITEGGLVAAKSAWVAAKVNFNHGVTNAIGKGAERVGQAIIRNIQTPGGEKLYKDIEFSQAYHGIDDLVENTVTGNKVIVEYKANRLGLGNTNAGTQMSDEWSRNKAFKMQSSSNSQSRGINPQLGAALQSDLNAGNAERIVIVIDTITGDASIHLPNSETGGWSSIGSVNLNY
ncbi:MAG: hypothetical protein U9N80_05225, partial [Chloroflexota bacterium]|nr:hypothetical protein [Chloroflexota bacterium]